MQTNEALQRVRRLFDRDAWIVKTTHPAAQWQYDELLNDVLTVVKEVNGAE